MNLLKCCHASRQCLEPQSGKPPWWDWSGAEGMWERMFRVRHPTNQQVGEPEAASQKQLLISTSLWTFALVFFFNSFIYFIFINSSCSFPDLSNFCLSHIFLLTLIILPQSDSVIVESASLWHSRPPHVEPPLIGLILSSHTGEEARLLLVKNIWQIKEKWTVFIQL